jgi:hypothetical protein
MRLASFGMWPDSPHLENAYEVWPDRPPVNAIGRFVLGLMHDESHLGQIEEIVRQARVARQALPGGKEVPASATGSVPTR